MAKGCIQADFIGWTTFKYPVMDLECTVLKIENIIKC